MAGKSGILPPVFPDFPANVSSKCEFEMRLRDVSSKGEPEIRFRNVSSNCEFCFSLSILLISRRLVVSVDRSEVEKVSQSLRSEGFNREIGFVSCSWSCRACVRAWRGEAACGRRDLHFRGWSWRSQDFLLCFAPP